MVDQAGGFAWWRDPLLASPWRAYVLAVAGQEDGDGG